MIETISHPIDNIRIRFKSFSVMLSMNPVVFSAPLGAVVHQKLEKFKYSPIWRSVYIISMAKKQASNSCNFHASTTATNITFFKITSRCQYYSICRSNDFPILCRALLCVATFISMQTHRAIEKKKKRRKKTIRAHKKSIFRTTLDYVIRPDYASIDVACKHRIIREMTKILPRYWHSRAQHAMERKKWFAISLGDIFWFWIFNSVVWQLHLELVTQHHVCISF